MYVMSDLGDFFCMGRHSRHTLPSCGRSPCTADATVMHEVHTHSGLPMTSKSLTGNDWRCGCWCAH